MHPHYSLCSRCCCALLLTSHLALAVSRCSLSMCVNKWIRNLFLCVLPGNTADFTLTHRYIGIKNVSRVITKFNFLLRKNYRNHDLKFLKQYFKLNELCMTFLQFNCDTFQLTCALFSLGTEVDKKNNNFHGQ